MLIHQRTRPLPTTCAPSCGEALFVVNESITEMVVGVSDDTRLMEKISRVFATLRTILQFIT